MSEVHAKGVSVTFTPVYKDKFLFVQRQKDDPILGGYWCFPGGKVHVGETLAGAIARECEEETGLQLSGRAFFVDSYLLGERVGAHFAVEVTDDAVTLHELESHAWVKTVRELEAFTPRIPGIDTHLHYILTHLGHMRHLHGRLKPDAHERLHQLAWQPLEQFDLLAPRFLNS